MDKQKLMNQLIDDEGCLYHIYLDSLGLPTFGIGHLLTKDDPEYLPYQNSNKKERFLIKPERVYEAFGKDVDKAISDCKKCFPDFDNFLEELKQIIVNMMFNLGLSRFIKFKKLIEAINKKDYASAALEMKGSKWYEQTKSRAKRLVARMEILANEKN